MSETTVMSGGHGDTDGPDADELQEMSTEQVMRAGTEADGVHIVHRRDRFPVRGTKAEKRAERAVALCFMLSALGGLGFIVAFIVLPYHWHLPGTNQTFKYYTPALGILSGLMLLMMGVGLVLWAKWLMPEEEVVQDRHDEPTPEVEKVMTEGTLIQGLEDTGLPRRGLILRSLGLAGGAIATVPLVALVGAMIKKPQARDLKHTLFGEQKNFPNGVPLVQADWRRVSPDDMLPGGVLTVFPGVREEVDGYNGVTSASSPTLLIRLKPGERVRPRKGQGGFGWPADNPEFVAFSKICTHAGCPASLYEQQTSRLLCPCHQSQFEVLQDAKPVFGPASRPLPKLPLDVEIGADGRQYFVAKRDYTEPIGPGFWERGDHG